MSLDLALLLGAGVTLVAVFAARVGSRLGLPALLLFLLVGMGLGESGLGVRFNDAALAHDLGFAALVMILAEGGFTTKWAEIRPSLKAAGSLATIGILVSIGAMAAFAHLVLGVPIVVALLLGAVTAPTDSAAVFSVLRGVPLPARLRATLEGESGLNDAPTVLLVLLFTELALAHAHPPYWLVALEVAGELAGGIALGAAVGFLAVAAMRHIALPSSGLYPLAALAWAIAAYGLGVAVHVSGFAAVYVCSVVLGNGGLPHRHAVRSFAEGVGWISQIGLFVMLGLLATPERVTWNSVWVGILAGLFLTFGARPLSVFASTSWLGMPWRHQVFLSWAGLRGAVPIILATVPMAEHMPGADQLFDVVLVFVVLFTALQAPTLPWVGRRLGLVTDTASEVEIEAAPLDTINADLLQIKVPDGSRLAGVSVGELRLPANAVVSLVIRGSNQFAPGGRDVLRSGDEVLVVAPTRDRGKVEATFTEVGRAGRLARWYGVRAEGKAVVEDRRQQVLRGRLPDDVSGDAERQP